MVINKNEESLDFVYFIWICLIVLSAPFVIYGFSYHGISIRLCRVFTVLMFPFFLIKVKRKPSLIFRDKFFVYLLLPFIFLSGVSLFWTPDISRSFGVNRWASFIEVILIYLYIIAADLDVSNYKKLLSFFLISALCSVFVGLWQGLNSLIHFSVAEVPLKSFLILGKYDEFKDRFFIAVNGVTRATSTFAEPTIFGTFVGSALLLSFSFEPKSKNSLFVLRFVQVASFVSLTLTLSKLAIITFIIGLLVMYRGSIAKIFKVGASCFLLGLLGFLVLSQYQYMDYFFKRFFTLTGHIELLTTSIFQFRDFKAIELIFGKGIGSIPYLTTNKLLLSRAYENGIFGLFFAILLSLIPALLLLSKNEGEYFLRLNNINFAVLVSIVVGFNLYDNFIYTWPWIVIGMIMSLYWNEESKSSVNPS